MTQSNLNYLGPLDQAEPPRMRRRRLPRVPLAFLVVVVVPTVIAMIYYLLIASPRYVSEARFMVRSGGMDSPSALGIALQGVGISNSSTNTFAVHEYITSRDSLTDLSRTLDVRKIYSHPGVDFLSKRPLPWDGGSSEAFYSGFQSYVVVGYETTTGISTLRVEAFSPRDAQRVNDALLKGGEQLINRLNERSSQDAINEAQRSLAEAQTRLDGAQANLTSFRNQEGIIDPARTALASTQMIGELKLQLATMTAERNQVAADTPGSPQLPIMESRIRALQQQINVEEARVAGQSGSLAPKISAYEDLVMQKEFADRMVTGATASLNAAQQDARRQHLYLTRVVSPSLPDEPAEPRRWFLILSWFVSLLVIYGLGWLIVASIRESKSH